MEAWIAKVSLGYLSALGKINGVSQNKIVSVKVGKKKKKWISEMGFGCRNEKRIIQEYKYMYIYLLYA